MAPVNHVVQLLVKPCLREEYQRPCGINGAVCGSEVRCKQTPDHAAVPALLLSMARVDHTFLVFALPAEKYGHHTALIWHRPKDTYGRVVGAHFGRRFEKKEITNAGFLGRSGYRWRGRMQGTRWKRTPPQWIVEQVGMAAVARGSKCLRL
ncbi:hypothetical protein B0H14DRAFT_1641050 [Mycena olivaceomarginata]|nr:hypothetical protein B0H14DRAFT_1641050 [Mycena olivaceomarginata]